MAKWNYGRALGHYEINDLFHITGVVFPELEALDGRTPAKVTMHNTQDGTSVTVPISMSSMSLLPSPQQRELEKEIRILRQDNKILAEANQKTQATVEHMRKDKAFLLEVGEAKTKEIERLKAKLLVAEQTGWKAHSDKQALEIKRLEQVCYSHAEGKQDAERKWTETVGELDNTKNQLREVRVANGKLLDTKHELEKHSRGLETIVASQGRQNALQASELQKTKSQLSLRDQQYEGKCQTVRELRGRIVELENTGSAKERDEYSKALGQKDVQISQITKQAGEWKQTATTRAKEMERLADLVTERTKERDALGVELGRCQRENTNLRLANRMTASGPCNQPVVTDMSLPTRIQNLETRVTKLEEADGFPMESYDLPKYHQALLYMGGQWMTGVKGGDRYYTEGHGKSLEWDKAHQPTRWKPMPQ